MVQIFRWLKKEAYWLPLSAAIAIVAVVLSGFSLNPYLEHVRQMPPPHPYPVELVTWVIGFIVIHTGFSYFLLTSKSVILFGVAVIVGAGFLAMAAFGNMHSSLPWLIFFIWIFIVFISASLSFLVMLYRRCRSLVLKYKR